MTAFLHQRGHAFAVPSAFHNKGADEGPDALLDGVRDALAPLGLYAGASLTDRLLTVRFLSDDNLICQRVMRDVWQFLRPHLTGKSPVLPRIWLT